MASIWGRGHSASVAHDRELVRSGGLYVEVTNVVAIGTGDGRKGMEVRCASGPFVSADVSLAAAAFNAASWDGGKRMGRSRESIAAKEVERGAAAMVLVRNSGARGIVVADVLAAGHMLARACFP